MESTEARDKFITGLRELADFLESHPGAPIPLHGYTFNLFVETPQQMAEAARAIGSARKLRLDTWFAITRTFGSITYDVNIAREKVCVAKVVGERVVPEQVIPEHVEMETEWECSESFLASAEASE